MPADTKPEVLRYIEDETLVQQVVEIGLQDAGFAVVLAMSGEDGVGILEDAKQAVIALIIDVNLGPGMDGWEVARHARALHPDLPVIYVSGKEGHEWTVQGVPHSVMISKPFAPAQIVVAVSSLLNATDPQG